MFYELTNVHFSYLRKFSALCGINLTIHRGEKIAIIGANGSGKSTLLHILDGLIFPTEGIVKA
ncbi:MAG: ATP-binding cassette domain-containing protein, partial [Desulfobacterota bacterium]|nr:ATP-binding cassette domain-containing protein [Thermodesulfobacteriota bacterium]